MKQKFSVLVLLFIAVRFGMAQTPDAEGSLVKWMSLQEAMAKMEKQPRPIIMDFYTDWCGWCKHMMKTTYAAKDLSDYINTNFYPVKFNAEGKDTVEYLGKTYMPTSNAPRTTHPLAAKLLQNQLMYPTTLFLNNYDKTKQEFVFSMLAQGYLEGKKIEPILIFTLENAFRNSGYEDFRVQFEKAFYDTATDAKQKDIDWKKPGEVFGKKDSLDKKTLVFIHTDWCNACKVMKRTSFSDPLNGEYIKKTFNLVDFDPQTAEPILFKGKTYTNPQSQQMPFHQLAATLSRNSITFPTMVVLDEKQEIVDVIPFYLNPAVLTNIATFYGSNIYKQKSWKDFMEGQK